MACAAHLAHVREHDFDLHSYSAKDPSMISYLDLSRVNDDSIDDRHPKSSSVKNNSLPTTKKRARPPEESKSSVDNNESEDYHESDFERDFEVFMSQSTDAS